jgi:hypothetical protein
MIEADFENLARGFPEEPSPAEEELLQTLRTLYRQAQAWKADKQKKFELWRGLFDMAPPSSPNPKVPTVATPVVRQKADGIRAHIKVSLDRTPFFTVRPLTSEAADAVPALEAIMQRELEATGSLREIERAIDDAVIYGTGVLMMTVDYRDGVAFVGLKSVPIMKVYAWPNRAEPDKLAWFRVFHSPWWEMDRLAREGYYRPEAVEKLRTVRGFATDYQTPSDAESGGNYGVSDELAWHTLVEGWFVDKGVLTKAIFHPFANVILRLERDPFGGVMNRPPFFPVYIDPDHYEIWGHGIAEVVAPYQLVADVALNAEVAATQYKAYPPVLVRANSQLHRAIQRGQTIMPGQVLPYDGPDPEEALRVLEYSVNPFNIQMLQLMNQLTEDATVSDFIVPGQPLGGRKTATEVSITATISQLKLQNYLRHIMHGLEDLANHYWKAIVGLKIKNAALPGLPRGVYRTYAYGGGRDKVYVAAKTVRLTVSVEGVPYEIYIPGAERDDIEWKLTGNATVAEREMRLQRLTALLTPAMIQLIGIARQDPGVYHLMKRFLEALGMGYDVAAILGPEPQPMSPGMAVMQGLLQGMAEAGGEGGGENLERGARGAQQGPLEGALQGVG